MSTRPIPAAVGRSPLEAVAVPVVVVLLTGGALLWAAGVVVGSILGASLPGSASEGMAAMAAVFPDVGAAWNPPIPTVLVWAAAIAVGAVVAPLVWRLLPHGSLQDGGVRWATSRDLQQAGLLIPDQVVAHSVPEELDGG